ncbi:MAG: radical SAM protein [Desulfuromonadales bacterium]|nr:radical SAM protein [Desulfuromonadales bacterium]
MRIFLIQPPCCDPLMDQIYLFEPLALEYLGAGLKADGHQIELFDARLDPDLDTAFQRFRPQLVGLTGFTSHLNINLALARRLKKLDPELTVVVGGHHATVRPDDFNDPAINVIVRGEGVVALRAIVNALEADTPLAVIPGLAIPAPDGLLLTPERPYTPLDELPLPDRSLTAAYRDRYFSEWFQPLASIRTSLGCTARCNFCALWAITDGKYLRRDPARVIEELQLISEPHVFFCDDESMCDAGRMDDLADRIAAAGIRKTYFLYARVDTIVRHPQLFAKWAKIGLKQVFVGMEDFSDARLAAMGKGTTIAEQAEAVRILKDLGVMTYASFMVDPDYSREDFAGLLAHIHRLKLTSATFTVMTPLPGTALHRQVADRLLSQRPELFDMLHALIPTRLPLPVFYDELAKLYEKAIPLHRVLPTLFKFGWRNLGVRLRLFGLFLAKVRRAHLDYDKESL